MPNDFKHIGIFIEAKKNTFFFEKLSYCDVTKY